MEAQGKLLFPILVRGDWGPQAGCKALQNRLCCYFLSQKKSGGGECIVEFCDGQIRVCFAEEEARKRVLAKEVHELDLPEKGKVKLELQLPEATEKQRAEEVTIPKSESMSTEAAEVPARKRVLAKEVHELDLPEKGKVKLELQLPEATEKQRAKEVTIPKSESMSTEAAEVPGDVTSAEEDITEDTDSIQITFSGGAVDDDVLEMYFENKRKSGGGPVKSVGRGNEGIQVVFENVNDAREVLNRRTHAIQNAHMQVKPGRRTCIEKACIEKEQPPTVRSSAVVLQNVPERMSLEMVTLLIENISDDLAEDDFIVELIPELTVAVVTLKNSNGLMDFIQKCTQNNRIKQSKIIARPLECTKSIKAENLPANVLPDYITIYFESSKHGGGRVSDTEFLPEENAAIVTFYDQKVLTSVLEKPHKMEGSTISVYPYYSSLGTALYGKERPVLKLPEPIKLTLNTYTLQFFLMNNQIREHINIEMKGSNCELTWPDSTSPCTEVIISPTPSLSRERKLLAKVVKEWNSLVPEKFLSLLSKYSATEVTVNPNVWDTIKEKVNSAMEDGVSIIPEVNKRKVVLVGTVEKVGILEQRFNDILAETMKQIERENQSIEEGLHVSAAVYAILHRDKLEETIRKAFPYLEYSYDAFASIIKLVGLPWEVFGAKSKVLEHERTLKQKAIKLSPQVVHFLQQAKNIELSDILFTSKNINAVYKLESNMVVLMGNSENAIGRAEKEIEQGIICKCVTVEDHSVTKMKEWRELISTLKTRFNVQSTAVIIDIEENQVVIVGYSEVVTTVYNEVSKFIDLNTHIVESIPFKYEVVAQFLKEEKKDIILAIQQKNINLNFNHNAKKEISLSGPRRDVRLMAEKVRQLLSSLHEKVLPVNKPGAKKFFENQDDTWVINVRQKFNCSIRLAKNGEEYEDVIEVQAGLPTHLIKLQCGTMIGVYKDDLTKHSVDVVVNASNEDLKHIGGLAFALLKAAGPRLQTECDEIVERRGKLSPGEVVVSPPGNLLCKQVIHAVGPRWHDASAAVSESLLKKVVKSSLNLAELFGHRSIAIPAISSGVFGFPLDRCTDNIVLSLKEHMEDINSKRDLKEIHLVDYAPKTVAAFTHALKKHFGDRSYILPMSNPRRSNETDKKNPRSQVDDQIVKTNEGLTIILRAGNIQDSTTAVIVNSISADLNLAAGAVSNALLQKAGPNLQALLTAAAAQHGNVNVGSVLQTDGCNLNCKKVFHVVAPSWKSQASAEVLQDVIKDCLKITEKLALKSIAFPAIGTGNLGFPKPEAADSMLGQVLKSSVRKNFKNLQEVYFVLHPSDKATIKAFSDELEKRFGTNVTYKKYIPQKSASSAAGVPTTSKLTQSSGIIGPISVPTLGVYEMQVGPFTLEVKSGDITKETSDVIVNSTTKTFNLKQGVSKAILEAAGQAVELECAQQAALKNNGYITTTNGALQCKNIIHVVGQTDPKQIKTVIENVLQECEQHQHTSVAFPAMGTGQGGANPSLVADSMIESVIDFASQKNAQYLKKIAIVIFQAQMLEPFHTCMKNKQGTKIPEQKSVLSRMTSLIFGSKKTVQEKNTNFILGDKIEPAIFQICGENKDNVEKAASWIEKLIIEEQFANTIKDEWIAEFGEPERLKLNELQNSLQILIKVNCQQDESSIQVTGLTRDVMKASNEIQEMIKKINKQSSQKRHAELVSNIVQWQYEVGGKFVAFDALANLELEKAFTEDEPEVEVQCGKQNYKVNFATETAKDDRNQTFKVKRFPKTEENDIPPHWEDMSANKIKLVPIMPQSKEYQDVEAMFKRTCGQKIQTIERVQNLFLWKNYVIKKMSIDDKNGNQNNEKQLFHGTAHIYVSQINKNGFNRSFAGMNAAVIGNGTYFAVNANYSAHDTYSKPDPATGMKYMYLTRVLTGAYCGGKGGILTPPAKSTQDPTDLYDSVTDKVANPSMFVIFNDVQAYPEYLISFK